MVDQVPPEQLKPEHLQALYQVSTWINTTLDFDKSLDNAMDAIMEVTNAQRGFLMINPAGEEDDPDKMEVLVARSHDGESPDKEGYSTTIVKEVFSTRQPLLTNNAQFDTRFSAGQSIIMRGLRAILCSPMMVQDRLIGVVYVDTAMKAGTFRPDDMALMQAVSGLAARAIENARLYHVAKEKGRLEHQLQMAYDIQQSLMPQEMPKLKGYELVPYWEPAREVAGDFYDAFKLEDGSLGAVMADVSDKGAPAALFMAVARTLLRSHAHADMTPVEAMSRTNDLLTVDGEQSGMFVTMFYSHLMPDGKSVHVNGGHNPPLYYHHKTGKIEYMPQGGRALGWFPDAPFEAVELQLEPGDVIVYYTDGLSEAENPQAEPYGEDRLAKVVSLAAGKSAAEVKEMILNDVERFCDGQPPFDDMTMLIMRYTG